MLALLATLFAPAHAAEEGVWGFPLAFAHVGGAGLAAAPMVLFDDPRPRPTKGLVQAHLVGIQLDEGVAYDSRVSFGMYGAGNVGWEGRSMLFARNGQWTADTSAFLLTSITPVEGPFTAELLIGAHVRADMLWEGTETPTYPISWQGGGGPAAGLRLGLRPVDPLILEVEGIGRPLVGGGDVSATLRILPTPHPKTPDVPIGSVDLGWGYVAETDSHRASIGFTMGF